MRTVLDALAVFVGGMLGTALRLALDAALPHADDQFPLSTLVINTLGSLALGYLVARVWPVVSPRWRAAVGPGLLGGFTTFSAVVVALVTLTDAGQVAVAAGYLLLTLVLGVGAAALGLRLGARGAPSASAAPGASGAPRASGAPPIEGATE